MKRSTSSSGLSYSFSSTGAPWIFEVRARYEAYLARTGPLLPTSWDRVALEAEAPVRQTAAEHLEAAERRLARLQAEYPRADPAMLVQCYSETITDDPATLAVLAARYGDADVDVDFGIVGDPGAAEAAA